MTTYAYDKQPVSPEVDWARAAANAVLKELSDRKGIGGELDLIDMDIRVEIVDTLAEIIRETEAKK